MKERVKGVDGEHQRDSEKERSGWRARDRRQHMGMEIAQRSKGNQMVEEPYSDWIMGMEITAMMMTRREHVGLENNGGGMFWRAMEGLPERETPERERDGEQERE